MHLESPTPQRDRDHARDQRRALAIARGAAIAASLVAAAAVAIFAPCMAYAQRVTGAIQGRITKGDDPQGAAQVTATNLTTGAVVTVTANATGGYVLAGLQPGSYLVAVTVGGGEAAEYVEVGTGQSLTVNLDVAAGAVKGAERIEVSGRRTEVRTSEIATDVSREQIENLPQSNRNFLNFAALAPGLRLSDDELNKNVSNGGLAARQTNVFIDGVSLKNNIIEGGVVGQDASRGNPFPQLAIGGFRVLTQNYKAEYEQAGSAIISTVTRSGGNDVHGELYGSFQNKELTAIDPFTEKLMAPKPSYARYQTGGLLSGPLVRNKLFGLVTYEGNYQDRANNVVLKDTSADNLARFGEYQGTYTSPFREHLGFAKLSWLPAPDHTVDLSATLRRETDIRSFGNEIALERAENVRTNVVTSQLRHQWRAPNQLVNEATVQFLQSQFNPSAENPDLVGREYVGVVTIGGRDTDQDIVQRTVTLRDDVTFAPVEAAGHHQFKVGAKVAFQHYQVERTLFGNPLFYFREDAANNLNFDAPFEARFGVGDPRATASNTQIGLYAQDDWQINSHLEINAGVRWDIETNPLNNDYVTPQSVRDALMELAPRVAEVNGADFFDPEHYITDGSQRPIFLGAIQPRLGVSYDVFGDQKLVAFAGAGRYFDRTLFNTGVDEVLRLQYGVRLFRFSNDGMPRDGQPTILWDPQYLSREGLQQLIDQGTAPDPEIFLLENDTKPLHTDQLSFGMRRVVGPVTIAATFSHIRGENGVGFYPVNRQTTEDRPFLPPPPGFGNVLVSADDIQTRYTGIYLTAEKPYTEASKWGATATYTLGWSKIRGDTFNFDFPTIKDTPMTPNEQADERHRLVLSGIVGIPYGFKASTLITLGTGLPYNISDASMGFGANFRFRRGAGRPDGFLQYKQVDLRLAKEFRVQNRHRASVFVEAFNIFNSYNYGGYEGFLPPTTEDPNPRFGQPSRLIGPTFSMQFGLTYAF